VGTDKDQTAVAPGALRRTWTEGGRRYFRYATDAAIQNHYAFLSANYAQHEGRWNDVGIQIYHQRAELRSGGADRMREEEITAHRLAAYSDAVFAVIVTVMVLELRAPDEPAFSALSPLWPTAISYAVSYLFIAIIWINHHYLMRFVGPPDTVLTQNGLPFADLVIRKH
jgi:hypothetical protein